MRLALTFRLRKTVRLRLTLGERAAEGLLHWAMVMVGHRVRKAIDSSPFPMISSAVGNAVIEAISRCPHSWYHKRLDVRRSPVLRCKRSPGPANLMHKS